MKADFMIRVALQSDTVELKQVFQNTVLEIDAITHRRKLKTGHRAEITLLI